MTPADWIAVVMGLVALGIASWSYSERLAARRDQDTFQRNLTNSLGSVAEFRGKSETETKKALSALVLRLETLIAATKTANAASTEAAKEAHDLKMTVDRIVKLVQDSREMQEAARKADAGSGPGWPAY